MLHLLATLLAAIGPDWFWHPLGQCTAASQNHLIALHEIARCKSYNWYSGFAANFGELAIVASILGAGWKFYRHAECHVEGCKRVGHPVHGTPFRACKKHHPQLDEGGNTVEQIHAAARDANC